jgi:hypothetical protein
MNHPILASTRRYTLPEHADGDSALCLCIHVQRWKKTLIVSALDGRLERLHGTMPYPPASRIQQRRQQQRWAVYQSIALGELYHLPASRESVGQVAKRALKLQGQTRA